MVSFSLNYNVIKLNVFCDDYMFPLIKEHFKNHIDFEKLDDNPMYTLYISDDLLSKNGLCFEMVDKWFDNASLECYIDNKNRICYATNLKSSTLEYKNLLIQYFVANVFNRLLEIKGYLGVHSSCVASDGEGVLFVAGRNNGKTACMLNMMNHGFNIVTNDKIALNNNGDKVIGYGIAQSVSIRLSPQFCSLPENQKYVKLALEKNIQIKNENMLDGNNMILNDSELAQLNNVEQVFDAPISCIINPIYNPNINFPIFSKLDSNQVNKLIKDQYMSLVHETTNFLRNMEIENISSSDDVINSVSKIPSYICVQNERTNDEVANIIKKLILKK